LETKLNERWGEVKGEEEILKGNLVCTWMGDLHLCNQLARGGFYKKPKTDRKNRVNRFFFKYVRKLKLR
jgi:hypothetical protein